MRELIVGGFRRTTKSVHINKTVTEKQEDTEPHIHVRPLLDTAAELEKRIPLAAQQQINNNNNSYKTNKETRSDNNCAELEELQELLHFPEEVALRLADTEYQLFYQVPPIDYLRQVTLDLGAATTATTATSTTSADSLPGNSTTRSSVATLIKRFNEVSAWVTHLIISQPTHDARRAVLSCVLRVALVSWNIGNFNGAMEIIAGLKSNKLKPFWLSITEKETLPVLDFLSAALLSAEYDRALSRALAMAECPVIPFFGAFLRELREILSTTTITGATTNVHDTDTFKPKIRDQQMLQQQRQVFISDYNGEDHHFTKIGPGGLINLEKIYRTQAVMDHIALCHQHYHTRNRLSPTTSLIDYLRANSTYDNNNKQRVLAASPPVTDEHDSEYECDMDDYRPVQPLVHDHGISFVCLSSPRTKIDQHVIQILHHGSTAVIWESATEGPSSLLSTSSSRGLLSYLRLDRSCTTLTWVRPSWSGLKTGSTTSTSTTCNDPDPFSTDFNLSFNPEETLAPGLLTKLALQSTGEQSTGTTLDDGFLDLTTVKEVHLGGRDTERDVELSNASRRYGLSHERGNECAITILYGNGLNDNRLLYIICPSAVCRVWYNGLSWLIKGLARQQSLSDRRLLWLREQYMQLYHEDGYCCGPLAADAIRSFGGRDWSLASQSGQTTGETYGLRREISMKIKKKQLMSSSHQHHNQPFFAGAAGKNNSLRGGQFVEPPTMCVDSGFWRTATTHHRQSTPTTFPIDHPQQHQPDLVARHHSLGQLAYGTPSAQPKYERDRHGSTEHLWHGRHPRVGSILYDTQLDFVDFVTLFRSFSLLIRKDLRDLFEQLAISYRSTAMAANTSSSAAHKINGVKVKLDPAKKPQRIGLLTRNSRAELLEDRDDEHQGLGQQHEEGGAGSRTSSLTPPPHAIRNSQKKIYDAIAAASIFTNCAGIDTNNSQVITLSTFAKFLETRQMESRTVDEVKNLIRRHEPDAALRSQHCLSFEGFARYLMDKDNFAFVNERETPDADEMNRPLSAYYIASSHNTYLTGHQLKGESSVELYSQVLLTGCRCVELDCWDGDDGQPMIYHGHTFTTKIPFGAVVEAIDRNAFVVSPYPIILSIENHCSIQQQNRMAHVFQRVFGDKLVTNFMFEADYSDEPTLPSPEQLKNKILIKNKKLVMEVPVPLISYSIRPGSGGPGGMRHSVPGRTSSIISNTSSSSFNDDYSDDDFEDEDDDDNLEASNLPVVVDKTLHNIVAVNAHASIGKTSSTKRQTVTLPQTQSATTATMDDSKLKKRSSQISKELSDMVVYVQAIKFRGLNTSPSSSVRQKQRTSSTVTMVPPPTAMMIIGGGSSASSSSGSSIVTTASNASSNVPIDPDAGEIDVKQQAQQSLPPLQRPNPHLPCYQCSSINENAAKKLCRKQPLALIAHTRTQLMRTYPAAMRIDSSNFNPVIFWSFGIQMAALNYQTEDAPTRLNAAMFESNGRCGYVPKPSVMWDRSHVMHRRFNPWDKEFDGLHTTLVTIGIVSGQYVCPRNLNASTCVEVEMIGIPVDCKKWRTRTVTKNALNPIWNETFEFRVRFYDLTFLRIAVIEGSSGGTGGSGGGSSGISSGITGTSGGISGITGSSGGGGGSSGGSTSSNRLIAQRILPLRRLRPGYRHLRLRSPAPTSSTSASSHQNNRSFNVSTLFVYSCVEEETIENNGCGNGNTIATTGPEKRDVCGALTGQGDRTTEGTTTASTAPSLYGVVKRRVFFLPVYGVVAGEPYTILKVTQETTTRDVLVQAVQRKKATTSSGRGSSSTAQDALDSAATAINDYVLVEEVARGWEKKDTGLPATRRVLDLNERPLEAQSRWKGDGRFMLKRTGDDPSSRAWLSSIRSVAAHRRQKEEEEEETRRRTATAKTEEGDGDRADGGEGENVICVGGVRSANTTPPSSSAWDENDTFLVCIYNVSPAIPYAILKVPLNACAQDVLARALMKARRLEEDPFNFVIVEELEWGSGGGSGSGKIQMRALSDDENVYGAQSHWPTIGRFVMRERVTSTTTGTTMSSAVASALSTPNAVRKNRIAASLRLAALDRISRGLSAAKHAATTNATITGGGANVGFSGSKAPIQTALSDPTATASTTSYKWKSKSSSSCGVAGSGDSRKMTKSGRFDNDDADVSINNKGTVVGEERGTVKTKSAGSREVHSEGETLSDDDEEEEDNNYGGGGGGKEYDLLATVSRLKRVSLRKFKEWKS